ncbi:hypothetical protein EC845_0008 [Comamonas sp. BIGb0124]|uniref:PrpF domain-containing protein n=1 Tax=Comamonas sp. BIGb0124 TaxID=2485130 RepID=UPI000F48783F|nr:PrpF domain-containing protein [Comamonas sp. BIGb0124]ROR26450.1 hypothetical protein EC845_0008 [Comamonas sp. BIGb0124]
MNRPIGPMRALECSLLRGGTSKGVFFGAGILPPPGAERDAWILRVLGSPDLRQIDGLGGADRLTSKIAIVEASTREDCDVDYLFAQVDPRHAEVDWQRNCGNLAAAAAVYALNRGLAAAGVDADVATVRIHQVNTGRRVVARVPLASGQPAVHGDYALGGVPGTGARIDLDFRDFAASALGRGVLPTRRVTDTLQLTGGLALNVTLLDFANLHAFVRLVDLLPHAAEHTVDTLGADTVLLGRLAEVHAAVRQRIEQTGNETASRPTADPILYLLAPASDYVTLNGEKVLHTGYDLRSFSFANGRFSKAHPVSGALALAVATQVKDSVVHRLCGPAMPVHDRDFRIGHPGGLLDVGAKVDDTGEQPHVLEASLARTARLLFDGRAYITV